MDAEFDVIVVGGGNAALCAALAAREGGPACWCWNAPRKPSAAATAASPLARCGSPTTASTTSRALMPDLTDEERAITDFGTYTEDQFFDDMCRVTQYRTDPDLAEILVTRSFDDA